MAAQKARPTYQEIGRAELQSDLAISEGETLVVYRGADSKMWARPVTEFEDGRFESWLDTLATPSFRSVAEDAAKAWDMLQEMYDTQDQCRKEGKPLGSGPRDRFESWLDALVQDAKEVLKNAAV